MSFNKALSYSFSNNNLNKVIQIAIVFGIISAMDFLLNENGLTSLGMLISGIGGLLFALFMSGYGIVVMQNILHGEKRLPAFQIGKNIKDGFTILLASLVYFLPAIIIGGILLTMFIPYGVYDFYADMNPDLYNTSPLVDIDPMTYIIMVGLGLLMVVLIFIASYAVIIGMARFANEDRSRALFEFSTNVRLVFKHAGDIFKLFLWQFLLLAIAFIVTFLIIAMMGIATFASMGTTSLLFVFLICFQVVSSIVDTVHQIANLHLIADFAIETGIASSKTKNDDKLKTVYSF
ncbi:MAG: DUF4013 domain-containing protein [Chloroflexota bacterium]